MDNLYNMYSLNELKFMIVFGLVLSGLCQYNKTNLAWYVLFIPVIYLVFQNLIVHIHVASAVQSAPKEIDLAMLQQQQYGLSGAKVVPVDTQQSQPPMVQPMKQPDRAASTSSSQPLGGGGAGFGGAGSSGGDYAYF